MGYGTQNGDAETSVQIFLRLIKPSLNTEYYNSIPGIYEESNLPNYLTITDKPDVNKSANGRYFCD